MKTITKTLKALAVMLLLTVAVKAQVPQKFNYQAIARNPSGAELTGQALGIRVSIVDGSPGGTVVYQETHTKTTNNFGLFNLEVGTGTVVTGTFSSIGWGSGPKYIKTEIDPAGGTSYTVAGTSELISVPYAIYSGNSTNPGPTGPQGPTGANGGNGADGAVGPTGPQGIQGPQGVQGVTGSQGPAGADGADGATGPAGAQGPAGPAGPQGPAGADGATGANGADGATGPAGAQGPAGPAGPQGPQGPAGADGATGAQGPAGANGATGAQGPAGATGAAGAAGATGPAGPTGLLQNGNAAGDTPYWNGSAWVINGNVYNNGGNVGVGNSTPGSKLGVGGNAAVGSTYANNAAPANGLIVEGQAYFSASTPSFNGSTYGATNSRVYAERNSGFGANNSSIFGFRNGAAGAASGGTGWGSSQVDAGVKGYSYWGNTYSSGVYGSTYGDYAQSAGTSGSISSGTSTTVIGHLGYYDGTSNWGVYTPNNAYMAGIRIPTGATAGYVLTSDGAGNGTWQAPTGGGGTGPTGPTGPAGPAGANGATGPAGANGADGATGPAGANGADGATGATGATGLLQAGDSAGDTPYWDGSAWVTTSSNVFNNGGNVGVGATAPGSKLTVSGNAVIGSGVYLTSAAPTNGLLIEGQTRVNAQTILSTANARGATTSNVYVQRPATSFGANQNGLYVHREGTSGIANGGTNWSSSGVDAGIKAYSFWGNQYTASLYGGSFGDYANTAGVAGVIGGQTTVTVSGFLAYYDGTSNWGLYTPNNAYMTGIRIPTGATAGYVLTSDGAGNGTWQAGVAGPTGPAGPAGAVGATGPAGANGADGADGATGPQGDPGVAGPAGPAGAVGPTGPTGPGGITGTTNYMAKFTSANTVGNSLMQDNGTSTSINNTPLLTAQLYVYRQQLTANGDGQFTNYGYRTRDSQNDGTAYSVSTGNAATAGYNFWGDLYTWGVGGWNYNDYNRTGGVMGADQAGTYWGSLGYRSSGLLNYGVYGSAAYASGGGFLEDNSAVGIGGGFFGDMIGSVSNGNVIGTIAKGDLFASYNLGDEYTSGKQIELVTVGDHKVPAYTATSTEVTVYKKGKATMVNGSAYIQFDNNYTALLGDAPVVTVTPMGACNGVYIASVDKNGFTVKELNGGNSNVELAWISIGDRVDAKGTNVPAVVTDGNFDSNVTKVLYDDGKKEGSGIGTWWDGNTIKFGNIPSNLMPAPKKGSTNN
jgi:hypothetical protein